MKTFLCDLEKLIEYSVSALNVVHFNLCVGPLPRIKISFALLSICTDELVSTPKITIFLPQSKLGIEKSDQESNSTPHPK